MARNTAKTATARRGLAMSGSSGLGKSTAALLIGKRHEKAIRKKTGRQGDIGFARSSTPSSRPAPHRR